MKFSMDFTETNFRRQLNENIQVYFDKNGIDEKVNVAIEVKGTGALTMTLNTKSMLGYDHYRLINVIVWSLMPPGIMYELVNVVKPFEETETTNIREFANIDTSIDVTMPVGKKKK